VTFDVSDANDAKGGGVNVTNVINVMVSRGADRS